MKIGHTEAQQEGNEKASVCRTATYGAEHWVSWFLKGEESGKDRKNF